jgi:hypothetical protein
MTRISDPNVPSGLRTWFVVHFWADILVALPLFFMPEQIFEVLGWESVDPYCARIVAAALFGIGIESLLGRHADAATFLAMLNLKVIWSGVTSLGIIWSIAENSQGRPWGAWVVLAVFVIFHAVWLYWRFRLGRMVRSLA